MSWDYDPSDNYYKSSFQKAHSKPVFTKNPVVEYYKKLQIGKDFTKLRLKEEDIFATENGFFDLDELAKNEKIKSLGSEQFIHGKKEEGYYEKPWPQRIGFIKSDKSIVPCYCRMFDFQEFSGREVKDKIISNLVCGRLFPTPMSYYAIKYGNKFGTLGIDLNNMPGFKSLRLDKYLESKGIEIGSMINLVKAFNDGSFKGELTDTAIAQLMLSMSSIPNAIGELDPNTRNAILMGPDRNGAKFDRIVVIDHENNRSNTSPNAEGTNKTGDLVRVYPLGMYGRYEDKGEFAQNIAKAVKDNDLSLRDINLLLTMNDVTREATRRTNVSNATFDVLSESVHKGENGQEEYTEQNFLKPNNFDRNSIEDAGEEIIKRSDNYTGNFEKYFAEAGVESHSFNPPPLEEK